MSSELFAIFESSAIVCFWIILSVPIFAAYYCEQHYPLPAWLQHRSVVIRQFLNNSSLTTFTISRRVIDSGFKKRKPPLYPLVELRILLRAAEVSCQERGRSPRSLEISFIPILFFWLACQVYHPRIPHRMNLKAYQNSFTGIFLFSFMPSTQIQSPEMPLL
jgi:hypothetical protein